MKYCPGVPIPAPDGLRTTHLPSSEEGGGQKRGERHPEMRKAKPLNVAHRRPSRLDPA
jgi:hypothetical protein